MKTNKDQAPILSANTFPVIGIGASAGGLGAFKKLIKAIPKDSGMAYVLVQHLDPKHESLLPELLQKVSAIPVLEIRDDIKVLPNHIYIIPSNKMLVATDGVLQLTPRPEQKANQRNLPIDMFFTSLAEVHQAHAIGVVLSGTGSDGTRGLKAIKELGGMTFAEDPKSAEYDGMPESAVQAGVVDFILTPEQIPGRLLDIRKQVALSDAELLHSPLPIEDGYQRILAMLHVRKGTDFTYYKQTTIRRRILRRIAINKLEEPAGYLDFLRKNTEEQDALYQDLLIPVTSFFRDTNVFDDLCLSVFPRLLKDKAPEDPIRIWVAGCSTGEEAYSLAICLREFLGDDNRKVQIFASDISERAIAKARTGIYSKADLAGVSPERIKEHFIKKDNGFQLNRELRARCLFAMHNFLKDPPFGKVDFLSCRNVLIYMEPYLQKRALTTFHYALNPNGLLLLGKSETTTSVPDLFAVENKTEKLFARKDVPGRYMPVTSPRSEKSLYDFNAIPAKEPIQTDFQKTADDIILSKYTPAGVVVNEAMDVVHFRGNTTPYLQQAPGKPTHNLIKMAKDGLGFELRNLLHKATKEKAAVVREMTMKDDNGERTISIEAIPLPHMADPHFLIVFHVLSPAVTKPLKRKASVKQIQDEKDLRIKQLERELVQTHEDMRSITDEQESFNEELQTANEELLSGSEELQSLNEELQSSKEELQSTNEELTVLNDELGTLNGQLAAAKSYSESIVATIREPLLVLDKNLRVKSANEAFYKKFKVTRKDTEDTLIYDLGNRQWNIPELRIMLEEILPEKSELTDYEVRHTFPHLGERVILLSAVEISREKTEEKLILLAIDDVSEKMQYLHNQEIFTHKLEKEVHDRTKDFEAANQQLENKNEELGKLNKELASFTYVSSHDLQEPLRKIQTFINLLLTKEHEALSDQAKDYFQRIYSAARRMQTLIEDLLAYSLTDITEPKFEKTKLADILEEVKVSLSEIILEKNATIITNELCEVSIIPFQMRQVLHNLISNSLKFSKKDVPAHIVIHSTITSGQQLKIEKLDANKSYCHLSFSDNGIGFDPQYKDKIFEVFQRLHSKEEYAGTGIGLAIVKKIIDNHNGFISAKGEPGKGSTFEMYLPA